MNGQLRIDQMYAFVMVDDDGTEGVLGFTSPNGRAMPLVGADMARIDSIRPYVQEIATLTGKPTILRHFTTATDVETIQP